ncbi:MAG TPA: hypothetical protein DIV79_01345 [Opitutae bacterium]|nr:hypothetical protein [Opitutaceae bacterium]HCR28648.1 hypothetical protein [Opitutae bacterium]
MIVIPKIIAVFRKRREYGRPRFLVPWRRIIVLAEDYAAQALSSTRAWYRISKGDSGLNIMDRDRNHAATANGESYLEVLPNTRATHADKFTAGINFMNEPGKMAVLSYNIHFQTAGDYLVWVRAFSTGAEDNGLHVGINGTWPESGQRIQLCRANTNGRGHPLNKYRKTIADTRRRFESAFPTLAFTQSRFL